MTTPRLPPAGRFSLFSAWLPALTLGLALALAGCAQPKPPAYVSTEAAPQTTACPDGLPAASRCLGGQDSAGAHYLIAMPADWNGHLVLHAHGGPALGPPKAERVVEDLKRWAVVVKAGYAWAGSGFAQGGVAVRAAAEDTERLRRIFRAHAAMPQRTILHGQSWGAGVAAKGAEMFTAAGNGGVAPYDAVLLTSGVLAGGSRAYDFRLDLRVVYQYLCNNHPRPDEPAYPLWMGLPESSKMSQAQLAQRTRECLGLGLPAAQRTPQQAERLASIARVIRIPESSVQGHLNWATFHFRDIATRSGGRSVFGNTGARYQGSADDDALNAGVLRYRADPTALAAFAADTDPTGRIPVPVLQAHAVDDPIAFVEMAHAFGQTMAGAGAGPRLVQVFTAEKEHSYWQDADYVALLGALQAWLDQGQRPTAEAVLQRCAALQARYGPGCHFQPGFQPAPLASRIAVRESP